MFTFRKRLILQIPFNGNEDVKNTSMKKKNNILKTTRLIFSQKIVYYKKNI